MIKYFLNRELAEKLDINLAKWKRWSREFLPPDPLGGLQSGFARQYNPGEAFTVFLGGHLVSDLKYSIPDAKQILSDLWGWLKNNRFDTLSPPAGSLSLLPGTEAGDWEIRIVNRPNARPPGYHFVYFLREIVSAEAVDIDGRPATRCVYSESVLDSQPKSKDAPDWTTLKLLCISGIHRHFVGHLYPRG